MKPRVAIALNTSWNLVNFRSGLIRALVADGYEVVAIAPPDRHSARLAELGARYVPLPMDTHGKNPLRDLLLAWRFWRLLGRERCHIFLGYTIKPNVYGSLAAHLRGIPVINNVSGLGTVFIKDSWITRVVHLMYRAAFSRSAKVFFQNGEDRVQFVEKGLVSAAKTECLPGSGVDLLKFPFTPTAPDTKVSFLLLARMLWDKGVGEFAEAAREVKKAHPEAEFRLLGFVDEQNPVGVPRAQLEAWQREGIAEYLGPADDVRPFIAAASCVVLPSYREGTPRSLLEAAAMGRPIITTDATGCREVVDDGVNGFLCQARDANDLARKMEAFLRCSEEERATLGRRGREKVEREFDECKVIEKYLAVTRDLLARHRATRASHAVERHP